MESVARHLKSHALQLDSKDKDRDLYGRTAFNRFYYAAFLTLRATLSTQIKGWPRTHASIPQFLKGQVCRSLKDGIKRARRSEDNELEKLCERAKSAAIELATLMELGYLVRVVADYQPEELVKFHENEDFTLRTTNGSTAERWPSQVNAWAQTVRSAWKQLND